MFDCVLKNGTIIDGTGAAPFQADVAIRGDRIQAVQPGIEAESREQVDAAGLCISPGFIDMHSHTDFTILGHPRGDSMVRQGVTTEVMGNCGLSPAPVTEEYGEVLRENSKEFERHLTRKGIEWNWPSMERFLEQVEETGTALNLVPLTGHRTLRIGVMGFAKRAPSPEEMQRMKTLLQADMDKGIFGLSTGFIYNPATFARSPEVHELLSIVSACNGLYSTHIRCENDRLIEAVTEAVQAARATGVSLQISHLKAEGKRNWGKSDQALGLIEKARAEGLDVTFDQYPYTAFSCGLIEVFPQWVKETGTQEVLRSLSDPGMRARIAETLEAAGSPPDEAIDWEDIAVIGFSRDQYEAFEGLRLTEIARLMGCQAHEALMELFCAEKGALRMIGHGMCEEDIGNIMAHPAGMIGSDGFALEEGARVSAHPRSFGSFPRVLGRYVREKGLLSLAEAIRKMTSLPADKLNLRDRGRVQPGLMADLTLFDPDRISDRAGFTAPREFPLGIHRVMVNGKTVFADERHSGELPGRVLRRG